MNISSTALTALAQAQEQFNRAAEGVSRASTPAPLGEDQVDLSEQIVKLLTAKTSYRTAIELAKTADDLTRESLDLLA